MYLAFEAGAYPGSFVENACNTVFASYDIENILIDGYDVVDNKPKTGAYRAPGTPNAALAAETAIDDLARELGIDPVELRLLNAAREGTRRPDGTAYPAIGMVEVAEALRDHDHYRSPLPSPSTPHRRVGRGFAMGYSGNISGEATVLASLAADGKVKLVTGSVDIGGTRASIAQQFGEVLGIGLDVINPIVADTDTAGYTGPSAGSSASHKSGWAAHEAGLDVRRQLIDRAARIWGVPESEVDFQDGAAFHRTDTELRMSLPELSAMLNSTGGPITGRGNIHPGGWAGSFTANLVDLEVDEETGKTEILRYTVVQDAGKAIHPSYVEGQMQGGTVQGGRMGAPRGVRLRRRRQAAEPLPAGLPHAHVLGCTDDRHGDSGGPEPRPSLRGEGRRGGVNSSSPARHLKRHIRRGGRQGACATHVTREYR